MAYVKRHPIKSTLKKAINYVVNGDKTDVGVLVTGVNCSILPTLAEAEMNLVKKKFGKEDEILAFHFVQSFKPGEIQNPSIANKIGVELANKISGGQYKLIVGTHVDKEHIHNHIIMNSVNSITGKKYNSCVAERQKIREYSDRICKKYKLSVITPNKSNRSKSYKEWSENKKGTSWKAQIKNEIDNVIKQVKSFDEFIKVMEEKGFEVKYGNVKNIAFKAPGQQRFTRGRTIGDAYTEEAIRERIDKNLAKENVVSVDKFKSKDKREFIDFDVYRFKHKKDSLANNIALTGLIIKNMLGMGTDNNKKYQSKVNRTYAVNALRDLEKALLFVDKNSIESKEQLKSTLDKIINDTNTVKKYVSKAERRIQELNNLESLLLKVDKDAEKYKEYSKSFISKIKYKSEIKEMDNDRAILKSNNLDGPDAKNKIIKDRNTCENGIKECNKKIENYNLELKEYQDILNIASKVESKEYINKANEQNLDDIIKHSQARVEELNNESIKDNKNKEKEKEER